MDVIGMGFEVPESTYTLQFSGRPDFDGLEVQVRPPTTGEALELLDLSWLSEDVSAAEQSTKLAALYDVFLGRLVTWNITRGGQPVPTTLAGLHSLDHTFVLRVVRSWLFETASVPDPLPADSATGSDSVDESLIPMTAEYSARAS